MGVTIKDDLDKPCVIKDRKKNNDDDDDDFNQFFSIVQKNDSLCQEFPFYWMHPRRNQGLTSR